MAGKSPTLAELEWMRSLSSDGIQKLWADVRKATQILARESTEIVLGIKAESGEEGLSVLRAWTKQLNLSTGILTAYDDTGNEVLYTFYQDAPVYIKYNSTDSGNAYMKSYTGDVIGVIFQAQLDGDFLQMGDFSLYTFLST
jgi:hypothetical protein